MYACPLIKGSWFVDNRYQALASVSGPIQVRLAAEQASKATLEVSVRPYAGIAGAHIHPDFFSFITLLGIECKRVASHLSAILSPIIILTQNPRTLIQIVVQSLVPQPIIQSRQSFSPSLLAACVNAAILAILNVSSFPLKAIVCAAAVGYSQELELELNPKDDVVTGGCFVFLFGASDEHEESIWSDWKIGPASKDLLKEAREMARKGAREVYKSVKASIASSTTTSMQID